ncbi:MAG: electron transfer flavoprotein subunit alpha/FixB family protein [Chloroflexota bacterium]
MAVIWVIAEPNGDGTLARISAEAATLARGLAEASGGSATGLAVAADAKGIAAELAAYLPKVIAVSDAGASGHSWAAVAAERAASVIGEGSDAVVLIGAGPDGRDVAGALSALTGLGVLANATEVSWSDDGPTAETAAFGGKLLTTSQFVGGSGIVTVRPNTTEAATATTAGAVEEIKADAEPVLPRVRIVEQVAEAGAAAPIEEARVIVSGGRGVGGPEGFALVEEIASVLGGAVGATRAAVDSGWIPYAQQIGQTGKIVKPELYLALGISGAIQHKVGMQTAGTIVAVNRDPDAPIAEFADLLVVGDLFEVGPALVTALRARAG